MEVVDRDERQPPCPGERLRRGQPDEQRPDQAGPARDRDPVDVVEPRTGLLQRLPDHRRDQLEMPPRRDFRHDAAEARVQVGLRGDDVGADRTVLGDQRCRRLVARRLEAEDQVTLVGGFGET
jgi:hypothetical protein